MKLAIVIPAKLNVFAYITLTKLNVVILKKLRNFKLEIKKAPNNGF